jgi:hypothetical protein
LIEGDSDTFWTIAAFDDDGEKVASTVQPGAGSFIIEGLKTGIYTVKAWADEDNDGLPTEQERMLVNEAGREESLRQVPPDDSTLLFTTASVVEPRLADGGMIDFGMADPEHRDAAIEDSGSSGEPPAAASSGCGQSSSTSSDPIYFFLLIMCLGLHGHRRERRL